MSCEIVKKKGGAKRERGRERENEREKKRKRERETEEGKIEGRSYAQE